ncbi:S-adenosylmethionine-dependent methyltransferase, YraL family [Halobacteriovorax sp. BALOs_7]|uniref:16S rRNA (cytidine(1402)-2'-O)-methyltransferase n=1 Tax=Halobacteriovorax sp. BALOs_7 TaxID=2109558 RepID=UPI000EB78D6A|nr:16S rRNA (cytidine(1402)-2'-O)-methyltransferase [Halobacteriovorax sp. BALOs_7]AYF44295.1 S-adenosylmethionine-dependent methyltransferase, YraL family [Halobacteriovorax sp. BALOs_7]
MKLTLVSTPIGNLNDVSERMRQAFESCDIVLAEDTRVFRSLLNKIEIDRPGLRVLSFNDHSQDKLDFYIEQISNSQFPILVSDAGSPIVSDPGHILVKEILARGGEVTSVPGPSAVTVALELSGFAPNPYTFFGFLPRKKGEISNKLKVASEQGNTSLFFESPHRIHSTLKQISQEFPEANICICRELTKKFEEAIHFKAQDFRDELVTAKGEFVIVIDWPKSNSSNLAASGEVAKFAQAYLDKQTPKNLAKLIGNALGRKTQDVYQELTGK